MQREQLRALETEIATLAGMVSPQWGALPFGVGALDSGLPGGGLLRGALHEIRGAGADEEDGAVAAAFLAGILARLAPNKPVLWCLQSDDLYGPGLAACGLGADRLLRVRAPDDRSVLEAMEEGLRVPALAAVVGEIGALPLIASRRLQLAAAASGVTAFALRRWRSGTLAARERGVPVSAMTRWRIAALPSRSVGREPGIGHALWQAELLNCRGGMPGTWTLEASDATGHVALAAELADRASVPARQAPLRAVG